jgi:glycosyltransferase involved in cell wall biosynthesis
MIGFIIFLFTALINSFRIKGKFDFVLASTPPVNTPVIGWILSKIRRSRFVIEIRDLQPESGEDFGNLRKSLFTRMLKKLMHGLYRRAEKLVAATEGIALYLNQMGIELERIATIKSGFSREFVTAGQNGIRKKFGWDEEFLVVYAGTLGWAHSLETIIEAARQFTDQPDVRFVFVGDGGKRSLLEGMVRDYGLKNVTFTGAQPLETIPYFLKASDVLIENLKEVPITKGTFPCKLFEYMASGRPILFGSHDCEAVRELHLAGGALHFRADDVPALCELITQLKAGNIDGESLGAQYRDHAIRFHHRERWAERYLEHLDKP